MIDAIISRYNWTLDYLLWGVSFANVQLMMGDIYKVDYKSREGSNKNMPDKIDLSTTEGTSMLLRMVKGK